MLGYVGIMNSSGPLVGTPTTIFMDKPYICSAEKQVHAPRTCVEDPT